MVKGQSWSPVPALVLVGLCIMMVVIGCPDPFHRPPLVGIIVWNQENQYTNENLQGIVEGLREEGYLDGLNMRLLIINAEGDRTVAAEAAEKLLLQKVKVLITLGTVPTLVAFRVTEEKEVPLVYSGVSAPQALGLGWHPGLKPRFTGTSSEVAAAQQLEMYQLTVPRLKTLGLLWCTATPVAEATGAAAEEVARDMGLKPVRFTVTDERQELLEQALEHLLNRKIDGLFLPADPVLASPKNLRFICTRMLEAGVPVMVPFGSDLVHGALLSYHADFSEVGRQTGRQAARILSGASPAEVPPETSKVKRLSLNLKVAQVLGLSLPRQALVRAYEFY